MNCIWILLLLLCASNRCNGTNDYEDDDCDRRREGVRGDDDNCGRDRRGEGIRGDDDYGRRGPGRREDYGRNRRDAEEDFRPRRRPYDDDDDSCPCTREYDYLRAEAAPQAETGADAQAEDVMRAE